MVQYVEHDTLVNELVTLENFSPEDRLAHARKRRHEQIKSYASRETNPNAYPPVHASHNKRIRFDKNIELIEAASRNDSDEVEHLLTQAGVSADLQNEDGLSALHQAVIEDCQDVVETLIRHGADLDIKDADLWTPLHAAVACGNLALVKYLVEKGASLVEINTDGNMAIDLVEDMEEIEIFLDEAMAGKGYDEEGLEQIRNETATLMLNELREAAQQNSYDFNVQGSHGETVMHIAAANGYDQVVEYLLDHGAKISVVDHDAWQPIHAAACWGHDKIIEILVNHGADLDALTKDGETPFDLTEDEDLQGMIIELKESGTKSHKLKRSQSNSSRTLSVRRTSIVEKHKISVNDAKQEGIFRQNPDFLHVVINTGEEEEEEETRKGETTTNNKENLSSPDEKQPAQPSQPPVIVAPSPPQQPTEAEQQQKQSEGSVSVNLSTGVHYKAVEQKISIESDTESESTTNHVTKTSNTLPNGGVTADTYPEGRYTKLAADSPSQSNTDSSQIVLELGDGGQHSHNTAVQNHDKELQQSTDMSVKKKCCVIL